MTQQILNTTGAFVYMLVWSCSWQITSFRGSLKIWFRVVEEGIRGLNEMFKSMDIDNRMDREDHLYTAFQYFDKDSSGYITKEELEQALKNYGAGVCFRSGGKIFHL